MGRITLRRYAQEYAASAIIVATRATILIEMPSAAFSTFFGMQA
jgi:hypothetical protein